MSNNLSRAQGEIETLLARIAKSTVEERMPRVPKWIDNSLTSISDLIFNASQEQNEEQEVGKRVRLTRPDYYSQVVACNKEQSLIMGQPNGEI